jgi:hypothetical protein
MRAPFAKPNGDLFGAPQPSWNCSRRTFFPVSPWPSWPRCGARKFPYPTSSLTTLLHLLLAFILWTLPPTLCGLQALAAPHCSPPPVFIPLTCGNECAIVLIPFLSPFLLPLTCVGPVASFCTNFRPIFMVLWAASAPCPPTHACQCIHIIFPFDPRFCVLQLMWQQSQDVTQGARVDDTGNGALRHQKGFLLVQREQPDSLPIHGTGAEWHESREAKCGTRWQLVRQEKTCLRKNTDGEGGNHNKGTASVQFG